MAILICGLASSCSSDESDKRSRTVDTTTAESEQDHGGNGLSPPLQRIWPATGQTPFSLIPEEIDLAAVQAAPGLSAAPIPRAVLAIGSAPRGSFQQGEPAVMSESGEWRLITAEHLGMEPSDFMETQFELSPDGESLAVVDGADLVVVEISSGKVSRHQAPGRYPVIRSWTRDSRSVLLGAGSLSRGGWAVDAQTGQQTRRRAVWYAAIDSGGEVVEVLQDEATRGNAGDRVTYDRLRSWDHGSAVPLSLPIHKRPTVAPFFDKRLGVATYRRPPFTDVVLAIDPASGEVLGRLASPRKHVSYMMPIGELDGWIVLSAATPAREGEELRSSLVAWDPVDAKLVTLVGDQPEAQQFSIAWEVLAESL